MVFEGSRQKSKSIWYGNKSLCHNDLNFVFFCVKVLRTLRDAHILDSLLFLFS